MKCVLLLVIVGQVFLPAEPHTVVSRGWTWQQETLADDKQLNTFFLRSGIFTEFLECALVCLRDIRCLSFFIRDLTDGQKECRFHERFFSSYEILEWGTEVMGNRLFILHSGCPDSANYFFSRPAEMCIRPDISNVKLNSYRAQTECGNAGERLVVIDNPVKMTFLTEMLTYGTGFDRAYHVGANKTTSVPFDYRWSTGETVFPGFFDPDDPLTGSCVQLQLNLSDQATGYTIECSELHNYICEKIL